MKQLTNRDFIVVGQQPWDVEIGSNCKNIALELSKNNRVLYVNPPLDRYTKLRGRNSEKVIKRLKMMRGEEENLLPIGHNLWNLYPDCMLESINWIKNHFLFDLINKRNNARYAEAIFKAVDKLDFRNFILFNDNDIFKSFYLKDFLKPDLSIYYSRDYMIGTDYWRHHGEILEPELIRKSDACVANSYYLTDYCKKYNENSFFVGQGCDLALFTALKPRHLPDLENVAKPLIGYVGALSSSRLDLGLIEFIAQAKPNWRIVLIGPEDEEFMASSLHQQQNIRFLGLKEASELPYYIRALNVCLNPQLVNEITIGNYPRKIDEYLALGKPVVAMKTQAMKMFSAHVYLAKNQEMFLQQIEAALEEDNAEKQEARRDFAYSHSWENSVGQIFNAIDVVEKQWV